MRPSKNIPDVHTLRVGITSRDARLERGNARAAKVSRIVVDVALDLELSPRGSGV